LCQFEAGGLDGARHGAWTLGKERIAVPFYENGSFAEVGWIVEMFDLTNPPGSTSQDHVRSDAVSLRLKLRRFAAVGALTELLADCRTQMQTDDEQDRQMFVRCKQGTLPTGVIVQFVNTSELRNVSWYTNSECDRVGFAGKSTTSCGHS
jgi:hypothetical protein